MFELWQENAADKRQDSGERRPGRYGSTKMELARTQTVFIVDGVISTDSGKATFGWNPRKPFVRLCTIVSFRLRLYRPVQGQPEKRTRDRGEARVKIRFSFERSAD